MSKQTTTTPLTPTQHAILIHAIGHTDGKIDGFPNNIKGGARKQVLDGLFNRALIMPDVTGWRVAAEGYDALGIPRPALGRGPITLATLDAVIANAEAAQPETPQPRTRDHSKQALVIELLKRPEGATIAQISELTHWQHHTIRGTLSGVFKKKRGLNIVSETFKSASGQRRLYRIVEGV